MPDHVFSWLSKPHERGRPMRRLRTISRYAVARAVTHHQITTIAELRDGLEFPMRHTSTNTSGYKRKSSSDNASDNTSGFPRRRPNSQQSKLATEFNDQLSIGKAKPSLYMPGEDLWENRIYSCLVVSSAGHVISDFVTISELLESIRDAIKAQSLYIASNFSIAMSPQITLLLRSLRRRMRACS